MKVVYAFLLVASALLLPFGLTGPSQAQTSSGPEIEFQNLDVVPFPDRLAFSRIQTPEDGTTCKDPKSCDPVMGPFKPVNRVHDVATLRIKNTGDAPLTVSGLTITGPWQLASSVALPATVPSGGQLDVKVRFVAQDNGTQSGLHNGTLTVQSDDADEAATAVQLSGFWQSVSEGNQEPALGEIAKVFGYKTTLVGVGQRLNKKGEVASVGEEVLSPYWQRADTSKPVKVRQLAAYHRQGDAAAVSWHGKGSGTATKIFAHRGDEGQTLLPRKAGSTTAPAEGSFTPNSATFGFKVDSEWSDPARNDQTVDKANGCPGPCGHHVRFWPVRDRSGALVRDTFLMTMDYSGINYDYQDNVYLVENVKPESQALHRLDVAGSGTYTDTMGNVWTPDTGLFEPSTAPAEGANTSPQEITYTDDDTIHRTYRGNVGTVPLDQRVLTYELPTGGAQKVDVRLHFAERYWKAAGKRIFDIEAEGRLLRGNYDIYAAAGGANRATALRFDDVAVADGSLTLAFRARADYPSIAGIEVFGEPAQAQASSGTTWSTVAPQPYKNSEGQSEVVSGKLYTFGGFDATKSCCTPTDRAYVYDPAANKWTALESMPAQNGTGRGGVTHAGFATDGEDIYWAGGYTSNASGTGQIFGTKEVWKYDVSTNSYSRLPDLPKTPESGTYNRHSAGQMEYLANKLHLVGGTSADRRKDVGYHFVLDLSNPSAGWKTAAPVPNPRHHAGSSVVGGKVYYVGGQKGHDQNLIPQDDVHAYDPATNVWAQVEDLPKARNHASSSTFVMDGRIVVAGGQVNHPSALADVTAYNPTTNAWTEITPLPAKRRSGMAGVIDGIIYFTTGTYGLDTKTTFKGVPSGT